MTLHPLLVAMLAFAFYYPLSMSWVWIVGGVFFFLRREYRRAPFDHPPQRDQWPKVALVVPCHNEGEHVRETIAWLARQDYPDFEILAVNDGSTDQTARILDELTTVHPQLRVIHFATNQGKATGLRMAALAATAEYLVCIDGDALLERHATKWLVSHLTSGPRVGAVTGNPRIRNRSTLLGRLQVGEFSSIIGLIKRSQRTYGRIFTVSGVIAAFRRSALHRVGYWGTDMITEDIDISWRLQQDHWDIRYEPNALCWILMPETLKGLWRQRLRWAQGGSEVMLRHAHKLFQWKQRRMWPILIEFLLSVTWSYVMASLLFLWIFGLLVDLPAAWRVSSPFPGWYGVVLGLTCLLQFGISLLIDRRYERRIGRQMFWIIWYPLAYWVIGLLTTVVAFPRAFLQPRGQPAVWVSPDRGVM